MLDYNCKVCNKPFTSLISLSKHIPSAHKDLGGGGYYIKYMRTGEIPKCYCGNELKCSLTGFAQFCSKKCTNNSKDRSAKILKTKVEKYGQGMPAIYEKAQNTVKNWDQQKKEQYSKNLSKSIKISKTAAVIRKTVETKRQRYGKDYFVELGKQIQSNVDQKKAAEKRKITCLEKYGVDHVCKVEEFRIKAKEWLKDKEKSKAAQEKTHKTKLLSGYYLPKTEYREYCRLVRIVSERNASEMFEKHLLESRGVNGVAGALQLDHLFQIRNGFLLDVPPEIIGCKKNLRLISWEENIRKSSKNHIELHELLTCNSISKEVLNIEMY